MDIEHKQVKESAHDVDSVIKAAIMLVSGNFDSPHFIFHLPIFLCLVLSLIVNIKSIFSSYYVNRYMLYRKIYR
jgi:hypothetical protein